MRIDSDLDFDSVARILNLPAPASDNEPARKVDLDTLLEGLNWKDDVRVATSSNINLASPGETLDGVTMAEGDRVLVRGQTDEEDNGIYVYNGSAVAMTRSADADTGASLTVAVVSVSEGTDAGSSFRQTEIVATLDTDDVIWTTFGTTVPDSAEGTKGKIAIATQTTVNTGTNDTEAVTPLKLATWDGRPLRHSATFGDNSATQFDITHNLGTEDVVWLVREAGSNKRQILCDGRVIDGNTVRLNFASAPGTNELRITVLG